MGDKKEQDLPKQDERRHAFQHLDQLESFFEFNGQGGHGEIVKTTLSSSGEHETGPDGFVAYHSQTNERNLARWTLVIRDWRVIQLLTMAKCFAVITKLPSRRESKSMCSTRASKQIC